MLFGIAGAAGSGVRGLSGMGCSSVRLRLLNSSTSLARSSLAMRSSSFSRRSAAASLLVSARYERQSSKRVTTSWYCSAMRARRWRRSAAAAVAASFPSSTMEPESEEPREREATHVQAVGWARAAAEGKGEREGERNEIKP